MTTRISKIITIALLALAGTSVPAAAGQYHVYSCRTPSGTAAPVDGWSPSTAGLYAYARDTCMVSGGALIAGLGDQAVHHANVDHARWTFGVPAPERLASATVWRAGDTPGGATVNYTYQFWLSGPNETSSFDECVAVTGCKGKGEVEQPMSVANRLVVPSSHMGGHLYLNASCSGPPPEPEPYECAAGTGDPNGYAAAVYLFAADFTLEQNLGPNASNVTGELANAATVSGTSDLAFSATDPGSGVYQAIFSVDGHAVQSTVINENGGRCKDVGETTDGLPAFLYLQPCLVSVSADIGFDTTKLTDGSHHLVVSVTDAAGNAAPVLDRTITVANRPAAGPGPVEGGGGANGVNGASGLNGVNGANGLNGAGAPNGSNASTLATLVVRWKGSSRALLRTGYGRAQTIVGRLSGPGGVPIGHAQIDLVETPTFAGAKPVPMTSPQTGPDGSFVVRLPAGTSSRTLRFAYRTHLSDQLPAATRTLSLSVQAGIVLGITPHVASVGRSILFRGRLLGGFIPRGGKQLVLEARSGHGPWLEFNVIRANARGMYRASYRFKFPGPVRYEFRAVSEPEADYPFAAGSSNVVAVRER
jgi:hypothetical protein